MAPDIAIDAPSVSYEEFLDWPESAARVEFVDGRAIVNPSPIIAHQFASGRLAQVLGAAAPRTMGLLVPSSDWVLRRDPLLVRQPDLAVVLVEHLARDAASRLESPPLLAVEILSPDSRERDLVTKRREYAEAGLAWYWLVSVEVPQVVVLRNDGGVFVDHASARGDERLELTEPFAVALAPRDLAV